MKKYFRLIIIGIIILGIIGGVIFTFLRNNQKEERGVESLDTNNVSNTTGTLNIRLWEGGFGTKWLGNVIEGFKKQYPKVKVNLSSTRDRQVAYAEIFADEKSQQNDLYFTESLLFDRSEEYLESLDDVYSYKWEGENKTIGEKISPILMEYYLQKEHRYMISSYVSYYGLTYNTDYISEDELPNTTDELVKLAGNLKSTISPIIFSGEIGVNYWNQIYSTWFAQYEGLENFKLMQMGKIKENGKEKFDVKSTYLNGSLEAMKVCEQLLWYPNKYIYGQSAGMQYISAQREYLNGGAAIMANGSWLMNEMSELFPDGVPSVFKTMRTPIISSIRNKCPSIKDDAELSALVKAIDSGSKSLSGSGYEVTQNDFDIVSGARSLCYIGGEGATGIIPKTAQNKNLAKLFLKYLYSDEGILLHAKANAGNVLPVVGYSDAMTFGDNEPFKKSAMEILTSSTLFFNNNKNKAFDPYCTAEGTNIEKQFGSQSAGDRKTAVESFNAKKVKYTADNNKEFLNSLRAAGLIE